MQRRRWLVVLGVVALAFLVQPTESNAADAGVVEGSFKYDRSNSNYDIYAFAPIQFTGTLTTRSQTFTGPFVLKNLAGMAVRQACGAGAQATLCDVLSTPTMVNFTQGTLSGNAGGKTLAGSCGGPQSRSAPVGPIRPLHLHCTISISGGSPGSLNIDATTVGRVPVPPSGIELLFVGIYTSV